MVIQFLNNQIILIILLILQTNQIALQNINTKIILITIVSFII